MNVIMNSNDHHDNVLPANNNSLDHDTPALAMLKHENDRLMELLISKDLMHTAVNSLAAINDDTSMEQSYVDEYEENLKLHTELAKKNDMMDKAVYNEISNRCSRLKIRIFTINELHAQLEDKNVSIAKLKKHIANLKGKNTVESVQ
nr:hypothetical protein [Tanacetum cinerariifolium]